MRSPASASSTSAQRIPRATLGIILGMLILGLTLNASPPQGSKTRKAKNDSSDYYKKWLREDVVYIISDAEKDIFSKLTTDEEKEQFIEQFWLRRDTDPNIADNEFKLEHYRRIQYANDWYRSGEAGWKTDRGRIYIMYGPPTEVTRYGGGQYERPFNEGGGVTTTYPFEKWVYRHIEGVTITSKGPQNGGNGMISYEGSGKGDPANGATNVAWAAVIPPSGLAPV